MGTSGNWRRKNIVVGVMWLAMGMVLPKFVNVTSFRIYDLIDKTVISRDVGLLLTSAFMLVMLNSLRALPIYMGSYLLCSDIFRKNKWVFRLMVILIIIVAYHLTSMIYDIRYDFGIPSILVIMIIYLLDGFNLEMVKTYKRCAILIFVLVGVQFLDVIPSFSAYGFGRGAVSTDIKMLAQYFDDYNVLTLFCLFEMVIFITMAMLLSQLLVDQHRLLRSERELSQVHMQALEARKNLEIRHLVHDLKTPLTTIEALAGVTQMLSTDSKIQEYQRRINSSAETMGEMISQILEPDRLCAMTTDELFDYSMFQVTTQRRKDMITLKNRAQGRLVMANKITLSRALVNLINNAADAVDEKNGKIRIEVDAEDGEIVIGILDNGCGIAEKDINKVWDAGFSSHGSTGLGMGYVRDVICGLGGKISLCSALGKGTRITIRLKEAASNG